MISCSSIQDSFELAILPKLRPSEAQQNACNCLGLQTEALLLCHCPDAYVVVLTPLGVLREILWILPHLCAFTPPPHPLQLLSSEELSSVKFSRSVLSYSLRLHGRQHARPPCPSPTPRVYSNSCPSSR